MGSRVLRRILALLLGAVALLVPAGPAAASCAGPPQTSPALFTGTVTAVASNGRVATVLTDDGRTVQVIGTPDPAAQATSVDRQFTIGARYEFHPINNTPPYQDNACTATRQIGLRPATGVPGWVAPAGVVAAAILAIGVLAGWWLWRWRRRSVRPS